MFCEDFISHDSDLTVETISQCLFFMLSEILESSKSTKVVSQPKLQLDFTMTHILLVMETL